MSYRYAKIQNKTRSAAIVPGSRGWWRWCRSGRYGRGRRVSNFRYIDYILNKFLKATFVIKFALNKHAAHLAMIYSASWQLARKDQARPGRIVPPSTYGTLNFQFKLTPTNRARKDRVVGPWCLRNQHCLAGVRAQSHSLSYSDQIS